jgi:hypothetical protein
MPQMLLIITFIATFTAFVECALFMAKNGAIIDTNQTNPRIDWDLLSKNEPRWNGILAHGCSSALIQTWPDGLNPDPSLPAYLLTAGHCMAPFNTDQHRGKVYVDSIEFPKSFTSNYTFDALQSDRTQLTIKTIRFATMNLTDLAVVEMQATAQELLRQGFNFYKLSKSEMTEGSPVEMVGYPDLIDDSLRYSRGTAVRRQPISEAWGHELSMTWNIRVRLKRVFSLFCLIWYR